MSFALESHHASARKIVMTVDELLRQLESGRDTSLELQSQISQHLYSLARELAQLEQELSSETGATRRSMWRRRIQQLHEESTIQRDSLGKYASAQHSKQKELEEREALLERRRHNEQHTIMMDGLMGESRSLHTADLEIDSLTGNANSVLQTLGQQSAALKGIQRKVLDVASTLGVSNSVIRMIESRQFWDKVLVYAGMILTLALLYFVFLRRRDDELE